MRIVLSRRNLLTLLHKLEKPGSARTLVKPDGTIVSVETDEEHYGNRPYAPGPATDDTEMFILEAEAWLARRAADRRVAKGN